MQEVLCRVTSCGGHLPNAENGLCYKRLVVLRIYEIKFKGIIYINEENVQVQCLGIIQLHIRR